MKRLTQKMRERLVPYLPELIQHWREMVKRGWTAQRARQCPLCLSTYGRAGYRHCARCPVFGTVTRSDSSCACERYLPDEWWKKPEEQKRVLNFILRLRDKQKEATT